MGSFNETQLRLLRILEELYGKEKAELFFLTMNNNILLTAQDVTKELRTEMNISTKELRTEMNSKFEQLKSEVTQTKWTISIIVAVIAVLITAIQYFATKPH